MFLLVVADDVDQPEVVPGEQQPVEVIPVDGLTAPPALHGLHNNPVSPQYSTLQYSTVQYSLHMQAVSSLQSRYLTRGYSVFRDSQVTKLIIYHFIYGWVVEEVIDN